MRHYGLIGYPLTHSFSKTYFGSKFDIANITDASYDNYELESIDQFCDLIDSNNLMGLNVTIPYKEKVIPFLDELDETAEKIGAVNTIRFTNGKSKGYNTDVFGFEHDLVSFLNGSRIHKAFILGTGGASKAVAFVLKKLQIEFSFISRKEAFKGYEELTSSDIESHHLIINTTPLGMYPKVETCPKLPYSHMTERHYLYDLVYNPEKTLFLKKGQDRGAQIRNGYNMLELQAEESWRIWNQKI